MLETLNFPYEKIRILFRLGVKRSISPNIRIFLILWIESSISQNTRKKSRVDFMLLFFEIGLKSALGSPIYFCYLPFWDGHLWCNAC